MTRTFIAVELGEPARVALTDIIRDLAGALPGVRFVDPESLHLTLAFLGELDDAHLTLAYEATARTAAEYGSFQLAVSGLGIFGPRRAPRVIWAGVAGATDRLRELQRRLADELTMREFPTEERAYSPHLTLAHLKRPLDADELARLESRLHAPHPAYTPLPVDALSVMKSDLLRAGARYTCLRRYPLTHV